MAKITKRIYATSASDGKHPDEDEFCIAYSDSQGSAKVDVIFEIPQEIQSYTLSKMYLRMSYIIPDSSGCINIFGDTDYFKGEYKDDNLSQDRDVLSVKRGEYDIIAFGDTTKEITKNILKYSLEWFSQSYIVVFQGTKSDVIEYRPHIEIECIEPEVNDLQVTGDSTDGNVVVSWNGIDVKNWTLNAILNGVVIASKTGTSENSSTFTQGTFTQSGNYYFKLIATNGISKEFTVNKTINTVSPTVLNLEPSNVGKLRNNPIDVTFTGENISSWSLEVKQNGVVKHSDSGSTSRLSTIQANVLSNGQATITLTATYNGVGYTTTTTQTSTFDVYGKPEKPILNIQSEYMTPKPVFYWSSSEQVAWRVVVSNGNVDVIDTGEQYGDSNSYKPSEPLENNTIYTIKVSIKNQYDLWSDYSTSTFMVSFSELAQPQFTLYTDSENAMNILVIESQEDTNFYKHIVYRREKGESSWLQIADNIGRIQTVSDCECAASVMYEYKVTAVSSIEGHTDSEIKSIACNFHNTHISIANTTDKVILNMDVETDVNNYDSITFEQYDGQDKPDSSDSGYNYAVVAINAEVDNDTYKALMRYWKEPLLCLRDRSGLLLYGRISQPSTNFKCYGLYNISFTFTECYNEGVELNAMDEYRYCYFIERTW